MRFLKRAGHSLFIFGLFGIVAATQPVLAQSLGEVEFADPLAPPPISDYTSIIDQFTLDDIRNTLQQSWQHGFNPKTYWTDSMEASWQKGAGNLLKKQANKKYLEYINALYTGALNPEEMASDIKVKKKTFISTKQLQALVIANGKRAEPVAQALAPQTSQYLSLQSALKKISQACSSGVWETMVIPAKSLKIGSRNKVIPQLKARLALLGYPIMIRDDLFDQSMLYAINDIQYNLRIRPDGVMSPRGPTWGFFNIPCAKRVSQIQADMEKLRWFPQRFEERHIFVNLMMSYFALSDPAQNYSMNFKVINGRAARKTPTMVDRMSLVILNPFWVVPPTIFLEDKVEEIKQLQPWQINAYFDQRNYEVWNSNFTRRLDPSTINWWSWDPANDLKIYIHQKPHTGNALGVVKFMLNNSYAIYLHDTNQRELFAQANRQLSSGCVRVEKPIDLAEYMLSGTEWTRERIEATIAKPGEVLSKDTEIRLKDPIAVYMVPLTSTFTSDGVIRFALDSYNHNQLIMRSLAPL